MTRLLRASKFCRPLHVPEVEVTLELLVKKGKECTVYGSVELLVGLSVKDGDVVWLSAQDPHRIPAIICIDDTMKVPSVLRISPAMNYLGSEVCRVQACTEEITLARCVVVRPLGRPVTSNLLLGVLQDRSSVIEYPELGNTARLLSSKSLIAVLKDSDLFVYQVVNLVDAPSWTSPDTKWTLESYPAKVPIPRLPPVDRTRQYLRNQTFQTLPHPSLNRIVKELNHIGPSNPPCQRVLYVVGTLANHADKCVEAASYAIGRRYLKVNGLAAFAHANGRMVTSGSTQDKLAGCQAAFVRAQESAPCVLHICNLDDEFPKGDEGLRHMLEMRLWTMLTTSLRIQTMGEELPTSGVPPVTVVLTTTKPLAPGPLLQNLMFSPLVIEETDEVYARYLWNDNESVQAAEPFIVGRTANYICRWKRQ